MKPLRRIYFLVCLVLPAAPLLAHEGGFPEKTLRRLFPDAENFVARRITLNSKQFSELLASEKTVDVEDRDFTFYVAIGKEPSGRYRSLGAVLVLHGAGPQGIIDMTVGYNTDLTVRSIVITENKNDRGLESPEFLKQFEKKGPKDALVVGKDIRFRGDARAAEAMIRAVRKGMHLLNLIKKT